MKTPSIPILRSGHWAGALLASLLILSAGVLSPKVARADSADCADAPYFGVIDGDIYPDPPDQITIDSNCTIRNYPEGRELDSNISFYAPGGGSWLVIYDNVVHTGQMSCNSNDVHEHKIWFTNSSSSGIQASCRDLFIPVEKIDKASPSPTAAIGVPFTYTMTIPVLYDANSGAVVDNAGSPNALHGITVWDSLNETGAALSFVDYDIYWADSGDPVTHDFTNNNGELTWELGDLDVIVPADTQFVIELTVVLDDVPANTPGTEFVNTAKWDFGRLIDEDFYEPLPGEWGVSEPMTIAAPQLIVSKTGPATLGRTLNLGQWGEFAIDVHNTDLAGDVAVTDAFNVAILDRLPDGPSGGMCERTPEILTAQVYQSDRTTPVPGKDPLEPDVDFTMTYDSASCELALSMLSANTVIGAGEHLIVTYRTQLDPDTQDGISLTNVAGATEWFNDDSSNAERVGYTRILTDGTPGTPDHQDEHTIQTALYGFFFEKTVANLTNGANPATIAAPGSDLRYTLRLQSTDVPLTGLSIRDDLGLDNAGVVFEPGSLTVVPGSLPGDADASGTLPNGGTNGAGLLVIDDIDLPAFSEVSIQFDIRLAAAIPNGTVVTNQAELWDDIVQLADSDDPNVNGQADPDVAGDEDPTRITIESTPQFEVQKVSDDIDGDPNLLFPGDRLLYTITVRNVGTSDTLDAVLRDPIPADTTYVPGSTTLNGVAVADGPGDEPPFASALLLSTPLDPTPGTMPADATPGAGNVATVTFEVRVDPATADGTVIENQGFVSSADFAITDAPSDDPATPAIDDPTRDLVGDVPFLFAVKQAVLETDGSQPGIVDPGDTLRYTITVQNNGGNPATNVVLRDAVPAGTSYVEDSLTLNAEPVGQPDGGVSPLIAGIGVSSSDLTPPLPDATGGTVSGGEAAVVEFLLRVDDDTAPGSLIINQATVESTELEDLPTDADGDPATGPEPTVVVVGDVPIAPSFDVNKVSVDLDGDPFLLMAGERLRYTIRVQNVGTQDAYDAMLRDPIPANTAYIAGSTTLNGAPVPDGAGGTAPFLNGMLLSSPYDPTPGFLPAAVLAGQDNVAVVSFDVLVDADVVDGTIIANQGFVSAPGGGVADQPSDDPATPAVDDPTRDIVGALPLLYAEKSAVIETDGMSIGIVDPGDELRYSIRIQNDGSVPATEVVLRDAVPANTTYVMDSLTLNGEPVGRPDDGVSPLVAGIDVSSSELALPVPGDGTISAGGSALIEFLLRVDDPTPPGTLIVNQATVESMELPDLLTDGDGNPATGPEPTVVVVGDVQQLSITKQVSVVGGGPVLAGATLEYVVSVLNISAVPATEVVIRDDLDLPVAGQLLYVDDSAAMNGSADGVVVTGPELAAYYSDTYGPLAAGETVTFRFRAVLDANLATGTVVANTADVYWNDPPQTASATVSVTIGGVPGVGVLSGTVWHDVDFDDVADNGERLLEDWVVDLYRDGDIVHSTTTDVDGLYRISGVAPTYSVDDRYELRFRAPGAGPNTAALGETFSDFTNGLQVISDIAVGSGSNLLNLHLPIDPNGVVYNAAARTTVGGAVLTMLDAMSGTLLPLECFDDPAQQGQVTLGDGWYKFDINFSDAACPEGGDYLISVTPPAGNFIGGESEMIPPATGSATGPLSVPLCLNGGIEDAIPLSPQYCEATTSALAPGLAVPAGSAGTAYYLHLTLDNSSNPGSRQMFNNHIPLDPDLRDSVTISKTSPTLSVNRGQLVPYIITVSNDLGFDLTGVSIVDRFPAGFRYVEGSARVDGTPTEPVVNGRELSWDGLVLPGTGRHRIDLLLAVGAGVSEGEFVNRALVVNSVSGNPVSSEATATVRLVPDPDFDCTDVLGKVYDDANANGVQDSDEPGIPGVRLVTATGLSATTDSYGRYHITCATVPNETRGSNFVMKLDDRTLPTGFRTTSDAVQIQRATRGKALRFNFSASIDRVIGLDVSDPIFAPGLTELRPQWQPRLGILLEELEAAPAVLRISYLADIEEPQLVQSRLDALEREIQMRWDAVDSYELRIETEVFWRLGSPRDGPGRLRREDR